VNVSKPTIERWERSDEKITGPIVTLLKMLEKYPAYVEGIKVPEKTMPIRLWYMHKQNVCTLIDVNELKREVRIVNYTDNLMFRAFGVIEEPGFEMYQEFLESRCFPKTRDKMKLILKDLDLPFYDPFLIIEKTEGRMAEDDFWIRIER
jgi:putative transcriptional regulator